MYAKIENNAVAEWPIPNITKLFPNTSFPEPVTDADMPDGYVRVHAAIFPAHNPNTQRVVEIAPVRQRAKNADGTFKADAPATGSDEAWEWVQAWRVVDLTAEELTQRQAEQAEQVRQQRAHAYREEADPLSFKAQRGEATMDDWLAKVNEIKARFPQ